MSNPAVFGYGFAAAAFLAFAVHLGLGWRGGAKASILLGVVAASAAWAAVMLAFSLTRIGILWSVQAVLDALRAGGWLLFLCVVLEGNRSGPKTTAAAALAVALAVAAWFFYPQGFQASPRLAFGGYWREVQVSRVHFSPHYHPHTASLIELLNARGVPALFDPPNQEIDDGGGDVPRFGEGQGGGGQRSPPTANRRGPTVLSTP